MFEWQVKVLTSAQKQYLLHALELEKIDPFKNGLCAGIVGKRSGRRCLVNLEKLGLVKYTGEGVDIDNYDSDVSIWNLTEEGRAIARNLVGGRYGR